MLNPLLKRRNFYEKKIVCEYCGSVQADMETFGRSERHTQAVVQTVPCLNLLITLAVHHNGVGRNPVGNPIGCRETQIGTAAELVLVLERLPDIAIAPELLLKLELRG